MKYDMTMPCDTCPFRREGGVRLHPGRARDIAGMMLDSRGGEFPCHKTVDYSDGGDEPEETENTKHCAGALIFSEVNRTGGTQMMRIMERVGMYDRRQFTAAAKALVFNTLEEMLKANQKGAKSCRSSKRK